MSHDFSVQYFFNLTVLNVQGGSEAQSVPQEEVPARLRLLHPQGPGAIGAQRGLQWSSAAVSTCPPTMPAPGWVKGEGQAQNGKGEITQNAMI